MQLFKKLLIPSVAAIIYLLLLGTVFFGSSSISNIGTTIGLQILLFIFLPLSLLSLKKETIANIGRSTLALGVIATIFAYIFLNTQNAVFVFLSHVTIAYYLYSRYYYKILARKRYRRTTAFRALGLVSIMLAITYTATIRVAGAATSINCDDIQEQSIGFISQFAPNTKNGGTLTKRAEKIDIWGSQSVGQFLGLSTNNTAPDGESLSDQGSGDQAEGMFGALILYQDRLVNNLLENQTIINDQVCDVTLTQINKASESSDVQIVTFVLLVLLLYVPMRTIAFIIGLINYLLINVFFWTGWFKKETRKENVDHITL